MNADYLKRLVFLAAIVTLSNLALGAEENAEKKLSGQEMLEKSVILNENGIISVTYTYPWFWEVGEFAQNVGTTFGKELVSAQNECERTLDQLKSDSTVHLGKKTEEYISSVVVNRRIDYSRLISSLLQKYANKGFIDPESSGNAGKLTPLHGQLCADNRVDKSGLLRQMFASPKNPRSVGGDIWVEDTCGELYIVRRCLYHLANTNYNNKTANQTPAKIIDLPSPGVFQKIEPRKAKGSFSDLSQIEK